MNPNRAQVIERLLSSDEPSIRWKVMVGVLGEDPGSRKIKDLQQEIRNSPRVKALLAGRDRHFVREVKVDSKYHGSHWTLAALADIGYPAGDDSLLPMRDQALNHWLSKPFYLEFESKSAVPKSRSAEGVPKIQGRYRRCASQQGNALFAVTKLGIVDHRSERLVERLLHWQWPDGGWNCDRNPSADTSSFVESLLPMRALTAYAGASGDDAARAAALKASEVFLSRRLFRRRSDGKLMSLNFLMQHYPLFWHYEVLGALKAMAEIGLINDPRCGEALDLLERKELPAGGWAAEGKHYKVTPSLDTSKPFGSDSLVEWGGAGKGRMNEWVTADALYVLHAADRV
jgi:hypothetical protein